MDRRWQDMTLYAALFAGAVIFFCLGHFISSGLISDLLAVAGGATCGWSWLLVRAIFQRAEAPRSVWPLAVVLLLVTAIAFLRFYNDGAWLRLIDNIATLVSSTVLLLALVEPLRGLQKDMPRAERRFRFLFTGGYATMLAVAVVWINGSPAGSLTAHWGGMVKVVCALLALLGMGGAAWYRIGHPMPETGRKRRAPSVDEADLSARIRRQVVEAAVYTVPDLKVADLARRMGEAEYKVTQCITGTLGFRNFNHMINHFRIEQTKQKLADPGCDHLPVLTIALDCGFGSIGPFNRAFKAETGLTPTAFRDAHRGAEAA